MFCFTDAGYMSSPERSGGAPPRPYPAGYTPTPYEDPYYSQYGSRTGSITPVIDEEARYTNLVSRFVCLGTGRAYKWKPNTTAHFLIHYFHNKNKICLLL